MPCITLRPLCKLISKTARHGGSAGAACQDIVPRLLCVRINLSYVDVAAANKSVETWKRGVRCNIRDALWFVTAELREEPRS